MSDKGKIARGKKWFMLGKLNKEVGDAIAEDPNKIADIKFYKENMPKPEALKEDYHSKNKDEIKHMLREKKIEFDENANKADLINLLGA